MVIEKSSLTEYQVLTEDEIVEILQRWNDKSYVLDIPEITVLFKNFSVQRYFKYNIEKYCQFVSHVVKKNRNLDDLSALLKSDVLFKRSFIEQDDFHVNFLKNFLPTLLETVTSFKESREVFEESSKIVKKCVFSKNFGAFEAYLRGDTKSVNYGLCKTLFKFMSSLYNTQKRENIVGFKLVFNSFCSAYNNFNLHYRFVVFLVEMIGFDVKEKFDLKCKINCPNIELEYSLEILSEIFKVLAGSKTDADNKINDIRFVDFIRNFLKSVIVLTREPNEACFEIFLNVIEINPLIIEPIVNKILIYVMLSRNKSCKYEELMIKIIEVFSKLHRFQNLIALMIPSLKTRDLDYDTDYTFRGSNHFDSVANFSYDINAVLPKNVLNSVTNCVVNLASWQVMNLFKTLLYHLNQTVADLDQDVFFVEILSVLTCCLLASVRMAEHTIAATSVEKFVAGLEEMASMLGKFGTSLLHREHNTVLVRAFLNICYNWGEIYMVISYYSINREISMKISTDNDLSSCNLTYLHPYLSGKQWCLISERITNFGEKPCKEIMQKLFVQKLKACLIFENSIGEDFSAPVIKNLSANIKETSVEILKDVFVINHVIPKLSSNVILELSDVFLEKIVNSDTDFGHIFDSKHITNGILSIMCLKINKLLKQKRKSDEDFVKKAIFTRQIAALPYDLFLNFEVDSFLKASADVLTSERSINQNLDLRVNSDKLQTLLSVFKKIPVIFCSEDVQKLLLTLLFGLHRDIISSNFENLLKTSCENLVSGVVQHNKFHLLDVFKADDFFDLIINNFENFSEILGHFVNNILKSDEAVVNLEPGIGFIKENLNKDTRYLKAALVILNSLIKVRKSKISNDSKEICVKYKTTICSKIVKFLSKHEPEPGFIEAYAFVLKTYFIKDENENLSKLKNSLKKYIEIALSNTDEVRGVLLFFNVVLYNKSAIDDFDDRLVFDVWNCLKNLWICGDNLEDYQQQVTLVFTLIANEAFSGVFEDLLKITEKSIDNGNKNEFEQHLKTWSCILTSNFNPTKSKILRDHLETLLEKLTLLLNQRDDLIETIIDFEVTIVQTNHLAPSPPIVDLFLLTTTLLMINCGFFVTKFNLSMSLLESLLKHRNAIIMDRLPPFLQQYRLLLQHLCRESNSDVDLAPSDVQKRSDCAHRLEKLTKSLVNHPRDMSRIALYLIADILAEYEKVTLYPSVKVHLNNCIYSLISLCDQHAVQYLMRVLSAASTEIFKMMFENYKKYYRFTGKV